MTLVCDTGPILHLLEVNALELLPAAGTTSIPRAVNRELGQLVPDWSLKKPDWLHTNELSPPSSARAMAWRRAAILHDGEAEALALAIESNASWFLTDDSAARVVAESMGVETHGSLGLVLWSAGRSTLDPRAAKTTLEALFESSLWVSPRVRKEARRALERICP